MDTAATGRLSGALFTECAEWVWEQLQEESYYLAGELVELILQTEREIGVHTGTDLMAIATAVEREFEERGIAGRPNPVAAPLIHVVLQWEDDFLGFAGIPRAES